MDREIRAIPAEFRIQQAENEPLKIIGYAARFNELSEEMWGMRKEKNSPRRIHRSHRQKRCPGTLESTIRTTYWENKKRHPANPRGRAGAFL